MPLADARYEQVIKRLQECLQAIQEDCGIRANEQNNLSGISESVKTDFDSVIEKIEFLRKSKNSSPDENAKQQNYDIYQNLRGIRMSYLSFTHDKVSILNDAITLLRDHCENENTQCNFKLLPTKEEIAEVRRARTGVMMRAGTFFMLNAPASPARMGEKQEDSILGVATTLRASG